MPGGRTCIEVFLFNGRAFTVGVRSHAGKTDPASSEVRRCGKLDDVAAVFVFEKKAHRQKVAESRDDFWFSAELKAVSGCRKFSSFFFCKESSAPSKVHQQILRRTVSLFFSPVPKCLCEIIRLIRCVYFHFVVTKQHFKQPQTFKQLPAFHLDIICHVSETLKASVQRHGSTKAERNNQSAKPVSSPSF